MDDTFKIFVYRLKDGQQEVIEETLSPDFLDIHEAELSFSVPVVLQGKAEVAENTLILQLSIETEATLPCSICNQDVQVKIGISDFYHTEELANVKDGVFDYRQILREAILLELPYTAECNEGSCPERESLARYFKK